MIASALAILVLIPESKDKLLVMVEPKYLKPSTTYRVASSMLMRAESIHPGPRRLFPLC